MDDDDFEDLMVEVPSVKARSIDWLIVGVSLVRGITEAVVDALSSTEVLLCQQANFQSSQQDFADEARLQIESMTEGE